MHQDHRPTRRSIVRALGAAGATVALGATAVAAMPTETVDSLWRRHDELIKEGKRISKAITDATAALPEWARPGPQYVTSEGKWEGTSVGWPIRVDLAYPPEGAWRVARPGPQDYLDIFDRGAASGKPADRDVARAAYRKNMRALVKRLREQRAEEDCVGLPGLEAADEANYEQRCQIEEAIQKCPPSANGAAALILLDWANLTGQANVLSHLRPLLTGLVAEHAAIVIENEEIDIRELPFKV